MTTLTLREIDQLATYMKKCKRTPDWFTFGPSHRKDFDALKPMLDKLGIGYFGSFGNQKDVKKGELPDYIYIHVTHRQAQKLSQVLINLDNKEELEFLNKQTMEDVPLSPPPVVPVLPESEVKTSKPKSRWQSLAKSKGES